MEKKHINIGQEEIYYYDINKGSRVILAIHGNFSSSAYYEPLFNQVKDGFRVIAPDLRGYGDTSYHQNIASLKDFADDLKILLQKLEIDKVDVLGWSLGGGVAMEFAANYKDMVRSLTLINSTTHKGYPIFKKDEMGKPLIGQVYQTKEEMALDPVQVLPLLGTIASKNYDVLKHIFDLTIYTGKNKPTEKQSRHWINESLKQRNLVDADWALTTLNMSEDQGFYGKGTDTIKNIDAPTLHIWGTNDVTVPKYMLDENVAAIKNSTTIIYGGAGHSPFVDEANFIEDIFTFIRKH